MPKGLRRWYGGGDLHYITCSCYRRQPFLGSASRRDLFLKIFEEVRQKYEFQVVCYGSCRSMSICSSASPAMEVLA
jgi:putative transposase